MANEFAPKISPEIAAERPVAPVVEPSGLSAAASVATGLFNAAGSFLKAEYGTASSRAEAKKVEVRAALAEDFEKAEQIENVNKRKQFQRNIVVNYMKQGVDPSEISETAKAYGQDELSSILVDPQQMALEKMFNDQQFQLDVWAYQRRGVSAEEATERASRNWDIRNNDGILTKQDFNQHTTTAFMDSVAGLGQVIQQENVVLSEDYIVQLGQGLNSFEASARAQAAKLGIDYDKTAVAPLLEKYREIIQSENATEKLKRIYSKGSVAQAISEAAAKEEMPQETAALLTAAVAQSPDGLFAKDIEQSLTLLIRSVDSKRSVDGGTGFDPALKNILMAKLEGYQNITVIGSEEQLAQFNQQSSASSGAGSEQVSRPQDAARAEARDETVGQDLTMTKNLMNKHRRYMRSVDSMSDQDAVGVVQNLFEFVSSAKILGQRKGGAVRLDDSAIEFFSHRQQANGPTNLQVLLEKSFREGTPESLYDFDSLQNLIDQNTEVHQTTLRSKFGKNSPKFGGKSQVFYVTVDGEGNSVFHLDRSVLDKEITDLNRQAEQQEERTKRRATAIRTKVAGLQRVALMMDRVNPNGQDSVEAQTIIDLYRMIEQDARRTIGIRDSVLGTLLSVEGSPEGDPGFRQTYEEIFKLQSFSAEVDMLSRRYSFRTDGPEEEGGIAVVDENRGAVLEPGSAQPPIEVQQADGPSAIRRLFDRMTQPREGNRPGFPSDPVSIKEQIMKDEGFSQKAYNDNGRFSIGYGTQAGSEEETIGKAEAEARLEQAIVDRMPEVLRAFPDFEQYPQDIQNALFSSWYRGSLVSSPKTISLMRSGKYEEAAEEFLDNDEYRAAVQSGSGVARRMRRTADAIERLSQFDAPPPVIDIEGSDGPVQAGIVNVPEIFSGDLDLIPSNVKAAVSSLVPAIGVSKIDADFLDESDRGVLLEAAKKAIADGRKNIDYKDYGTDVEDLLKKGGREAISSSVSDPAFRVATLVGRAKVKSINGNIVISDTYDFNTGPKGRKAKKLWDEGKRDELWEMLKDEPRMTQARIMMFVLQDGEDSKIPVDITLRAEGEE